MNISIYNLPFEFEDPGSWVGPRAHQHITNLELKAIGKHANLKVFAKKFPRRPDSWELLRIMQHHPQEWSMERGIATPAVLALISDENSYYYIIQAMQPGRIIEKWNRPILWITKEQSFQLVQKAYSLLFKLAQAGYWFTDLHPKNVLIHPVKSHYGKQPECLVHYVDIDSCMPSKDGHPTRDVSNYYNGDLSKHPSHRDGRVVTAYHWAMFASHAVMQFPKNQAYYDNNRNINFGDVWLHEHALELYSWISKESECIFIKLFEHARDNGNYEAAWDLARCLLKDLADAFHRTYKIELKVSPASGGVVLIEPQKINYAFGDIVRLSASPLPNYRFTEWHGLPSASNHLNTNGIIDIKSCSDLCITCELAVAVYKMELLISPASGGSVLIQPSKKEYAHGEYITISATPNISFEFRKWHGLPAAFCNLSTDVTVSFKITADINITCEYANSVYNIELLVKPAFGGTVDIQPKKKVYAYADIVTIVAKPSLLYTFRKWQGITAVNDNTNIRQVLCVTSNARITCECERRIRLPSPTSKLWRSMLALTMVLWIIRQLMPTNLRVESVPWNASVLVQQATTQIERGDTPLSLWLSKGSYTLTATHPPSYEVKQAVDIYKTWWPFRVVRLRFPHGTLQVSVDCTDCMVDLRGPVLTNFIANNKALLLPTGQYQATLNRFGFKPYVTNQINIYDGQTNLIALNYEQDYQKYGTSVVRIVTEPRGGMIYEGNIRLGTANPSFQANAVAGEHFYTAQKTWFETNSTKITLRPGESTNIVITLTPVWNDFTNIWERMAESSNGRWSELGAALKYIRDHTPSDDPTLSKMDSVIKAKYYDATNVFNNFIEARNVILDVLKTRRVSSPSDLDNLQNELSKLKQGLEVTRALTNLATVYKQINDSIWQARVEHKIIQFELADLESGSQSPANRRVKLEALDARASSYKDLKTKCWDDLTQAWERLKSDAYEQVTKRNYSTLKADIAEYEEVIASYEKRKVK